MNIHDVANIVSCASPAQVTSRQHRLEMISHRWYGLHQRFCIGLTVYIVMVGYMIYVQNLDFKFKFLLVVMHAMMIVYTLLVYRRLILIDMKGTFMRNFEASRLNGG